jgi:hypothetical protein
MPLLDALATDKFDGEAFMPAEEEHERASTTTPKW